MTIVKQMLGRIRVFRLTDKAAIAAGTLFVALGSMSFCMWNIDQQMQNKYSDIKTCIGRIETRATTIQERANRLDHELEGFCSWLPINE